MDTNQKHLQTGWTKKLSFFQTWKATKGVLSALLFLPLFSLVSCQTKKTEKDVVEAQKPPSWSGTMNDFKETMTRLLPKAADSTQFFDVRNQDQISRDIKNLGASARAVAGHVTMPKRDPSVRFISSALDEEINRIEESFAQNKKDYARHSLLNLTSYCIECHTRTSSGPTFNSKELEKSLANLNSLEKGEFLLASRQFPAALLEFEKVIQVALNDKQAFLDLDRAVRYALSITVKYQRDPKKSLEIIGILENTKNVPFYLKETVSGWKTAILQWQKEKRAVGRSIKDDLKFAESLVQKGAAVEASLDGKGGDIYFLRALSDLHLLLDRDLKGAELGQALFLTGVSYESTKELALWSLHESYFEACIRQLPHSAWSKRCYQKLEESIYFGYSGSSGVRIPLDVHTKLKQLNDLAM